MINNTPSKLDYNAPGLDVIFIRVNSRIMTTSPTGTREDYESIDFFE